MTKYIKLDKQIPCEYLCSVIQQEIEQHQKNTQILEHSILVLEIKDIQDGPPEIPKLKYVNDKSI